MDKLKMQSRDVVRGNVEKIAALFPHCVTETADKITLPDGSVKYKSRYVVDFDKLRAELSNEVLEDGEERYQFTWPDKRAASRLANETTNMTLRPCREESVGKDGTPGGFDSENLYIEGDNLDVLKVLRETYLGRVKMIYIDPPYNTGNDFVYNDDFAQGRDEYEQNSGLFDEDGNQTIDPMQRNTEANGRFHTDWLNMIYPRLKVARDLLSEEGVIFISIDDNEVDNLRKVYDEIFSSYNFIAEFIWKSKLGKVGTTSTISSTHEYILCYAKNIENVRFAMIKNISEGRKENLRQWGVADRREDRPSMFYPITIDGVTVYPIKEDGTDGRWRVGQDMANELLNKGELILTNNKGKYGIQRIFPEGVSYTAYDTLLLDNIGTTAKGAKILNELALSKVFDFSKPIELIRHFVHLVNDDSATILDFFSGSATTAHAVMKLNAEDGGKRKFIMVQLPEVTDEKSEARKAGYETICEIGKERIRRTGQKIRNEELGMRNNSATSGNSSFLTPNSSLDIGFRVLKLDSSNMEDVFYTPDAFEPSLLDSLVDNIKAERTAEDLLFQVMLALGIELSAKIEQKEIAGKKVFSVDDDYLLACFDTDVNETTIEEMAKLLPTHLVIRDASAANDNVLDNFDQIIESYSNEKKITTHIL